MVKFLGVLFFIVTGFQLFAQKRCNMEEYVSKQVSSNVSLKEELEQVEVFTRERTNSPGTTQRVNGVNGMPEIITILWFFHILYHTPDQNIDRTAWNV
jgi:hypothetical protein